jgi:DNA-binding CsgD family transcriptional regulator
MPYSSCILIHSWPVAQIGLSNLLQSLKINVREVFTECPDCKLLSDWSDVVILTDLKNEDFIRKHLKFLRKRNVSIVGVETPDQHPFDASIFDEVLFLSDNQNTLLSKLHQFSNAGNKKKTINELSQRETEVLKQVALGQSNRQISEKLFISIHTVITHRKHITAKLGVKSISGLTLYASINNLID